ncbi:transporter substrate-binding domain-containing protein [Chrysiogenes arsenatis]|uniref:transporter substrate-binding domain-containing protein n=1 Tax=Chrysiogenes arsenatis TaxID=309797 RepID=UPI000417B88C|nr:transporter substrate-binding domain-containing protein [Chrysiogenes arsenatis]
MKRMYLKKSLRTWSLVKMFLCCFLLVPVMAWAQVPITSAAEDDYPPFSIVYADGIPSGFSVELLRAALKAMGRDVTFATGTWNEVRELLEAGEIQVLPLVGRTPEREALFDFTFPYMTMHGAIITHENTRDIHTMDDLRGKRVAVMLGDNVEEYLRREDRGIDILTTPSFEDALHRLSAGECDAVITLKLVALRLIAETGLTNLRIAPRPIEDFQQDFSFAVKDGDRATLALLNEGLALVMADGTYNRLHANWFAALELPPKQRFIIGGDKGYPPYEYLDERGNPTGFATEISRAVAQEMGLNIEVRLGSWSTILEQLKNGEIDAIQGIFSSPERAEYFDFTSPYLLTQYVSVVRRGELNPPASFDELKGVSIVLQRGDLIVDPLIKAGLADQITFVDGPEEALKAVASGMYDTTLMARLVALHHREICNLPQLHVGKVSFLDGHYSMAVRKGQKALLAKFQEGLHIIESNGEYHRLRDKWLGVYHNDPETHEIILRYAAMTLIPLVIVLFIMSLWSWSLRRQVSRRTAELQESESRNRTLLRAIPDCIFVFDREGNFLDVHAPNERALAVAPHEFLGRNVRDVLPEHIATLTRENLAKIERKGTLPPYVYQMDIDGEHRMYESRLVSNSAGHFLALVRDITAWKQAEATLQKKNEEMERFVYTISHDLKSPLITVQSFLGLLQQDIAEQHQERINSDIQFIQGATNKMEQLLGALLQLSRVGRIDNPPETHTVRALIDVSLAALAGAIQQQKITITVAADMELRLHGDPLRFGQIWQNLIENAIKYMGDQPAPRIEIGCDHEKDETIFWIRDNGMGIASEDLDRVFGLFTQLDPNSEGSGLGLALVHKIVELNGGRIWVESAGLGHGSCFRFTLPLAVVHK